MSKNFWSALGWGFLGAASMAAVVTKLSRITTMTGKNVLITGGSRGLGLELARIFLEQGANVALAARHQEELERALVLLNNSVRVKLFTADVTDENHVTKLIADVTASYGQIDVLVNNAGVIEAGPQEVQLDADYEVSMKTHFWAPLHMIKAVLPQMKLRRAGRIVNIASIAGLVSVPHLIPYSASKHALVGLSDGFRTELVKDNIFVTTVCPGLMRTGSPRNADMKGNNRVEYALFAALDSLPFTSTSSEEAAREIVKACCNGDSLLVISAQSQLVRLAQALIPGLLNDVSAFTNNFLPVSGGVGDKSVKGKDSESAFAPSILTVLSDKVVNRNNEAEDDN
jgi:short-subunit dehydrogenase